MSQRLAIFVTHPIQYFAPLWRRLAAARNLNLVVHFFSDHSVAGRLDSGFGVDVAWDTPLLSGYEHRFLSRNADLSKPRSVAIRRPTRLLAEGGFDAVLIHGYTYKFERQVVTAARRLGIRTVLRGELTDEHRTGRTASRFLKDAYLRWFYRQIDSFCCIGESARRHLQHKNIALERIFSSPYSVDSELFEQQYHTHDRQRCRRALDIADDQFVLIFSGKLIPRKAPLLLLDAIHGLRCLDRTVLIILGDGPLRDKVREQAGALTCRTIMPGFVNQSGLGAFYRAADVFVFPSNAETWGLVANEAMHFALPVVVSSNVGCRHDLVEEGVTGLVFPTGDCAALTRCIERCADEPALVRRMGQNAQQRIAGYSVDESAKGIIRALGIPADP